MEKAKQLLVYVTPQDMRDIKAIAKRDGCSVSAYIRRFIRKAVGRMP
jgi:hypothetical protein